MLDALVKLVGGSDSTSFVMYEFDAVKKPDETTRIYGKFMSDQGDSDDANGKAFSAFMKSQGLPCLQARYRSFTISYKTAQKLNTLIGETYFSY
jgi:hypothetical protein